MTKAELIQALSPEEIHAELVALADALAAEEHGDTIKQVAH